jgi:hypothetical protein
MDEKNNVSFGLCNINGLKQLAKVTYFRIQHDYNILLKNWRTLKQDTVQVRNANVQNAQDMHSNP